MKIQTFDQSVGPATPTVPLAPTVHPVEAAFGGGVARAIEGLGEMGTQISNKLQAHVVQKQKIAEEAELADLDTNFRLNLQNKLLSSDTEKVQIEGQDVERPVGLLSRELGQATGVASEFEGYYKDMRKRYLSQAKTVEGQQALAKQLDSQYLNAREMTIKHEAKQGRLNLAKSFNSSIEQQKQDSAAVTDPSTLTLAVQNIKKTQDQINTLNDFDVTTSEVNRKKVAGDLVSKAATAVLSTTGDLTKAQELLDSQREELADDRYLELKDKLTKGYNAIQTQAKTVERAQTIQNRYNVLSDIASNKIDWKNIDEVTKEIAIKDPELAEVVQNISQSGGKYVPSTDVIGNFAFMNVAKSVINSATPEEASDFVIKTLKGKNGGNIQKDRLGVLTSVMKEHAEAMAPQATAEAKNNWAVFKSSWDMLNKAAQYTPTMMVYNFIKSKYEKNLQGPAIQKEAKKIFRTSVLQDHPELGTVKIIPNKIVKPDGSIQTIYEGNLGEYADFTREEE